MADVLELNDPQDLLDYVLTELHHEYPPGQVKLGEGFNIRIRLEGPQWKGGYVDDRLARYIIRLQDDLFHLYNETVEEQHIDRRSSKELMNPLSVRVKVEEGSSLVNLSLDGVLQTIVTSMPAEYVAILAGLVVVGWFTYKTLGKYWDGKRQLELRREDVRRDLEAGRIAAETASEREKTLKTAIDLFDRANRTALEAQTGMRYLVSTLDRDDRLSISNMDRSWTKEEAQEAVPPKPEAPAVRPKTEWVDGDFTALLQDFRTYVVKLESGDVGFTASTNSLREEDKKALHDAFADGNIQNQPPKMRLRVALRINPATGQVIDGNILMLNPPADGGAKPLEEVIS